MPTLYLFDLDGVVTDPGSSHVSEASVGIIARLLAAGTHVSINTGRSLQWIQQYVLPHLPQAETSLQNLALACEKGGSLVTWQDGGLIETPSDIALDQTVLDAVKRCFERHAQSFPTMFWDDTKRTMASIEKLPAADLATYHSEQQALHEILKAELAQHSEANIDISTISTDVEHVEAGKYAGARLIHEWAQQLGLQIDTYVGLGDTPSDYEMARYFADQQLPVEFVYVGEKLADIKQDASVRLHTPQAHYAYGVVEYFSNTP